MLMKFMPIILIFLPSLILGLMGKPTEMGLVIVAGSLSVAFMNIDKIKKFKGGGFEAEMLEVKKVVEEAYATIDNLKEISIPLIVSTLNTIIYSGRWGGLGTVQRHQLKDDLDGIIKTLKIDDKRVSDTMEDFYKQHTWDMFEYFTSKYLWGRSNISEEVRKNLESIKDRKSTNYPLKEDILKALNIRENDLNEIEMEKLKDYIYYKDNQKLRSDFSEEE